jgi:23S rRNA (cytosine1962-C5)-methyltransferase
VLDPPAYGRGPEGEKWILEDHIAELMESCSKMVDENNFFCVVNLYSMGFSSLVAENLIKDYFPNLTHIQSGELFLPDQAGRRLPLSVFCRAN